MTDRELELLKLKARCFDQITKKYDGLRAEAGFYSQNWVELSEVIETVLERVRKKS